MQPKAVILDIDGTVSPEVSWLALSRDPGASVKQHQIIFDDYRYGRTNYAIAKSRLIELWRATGNANHTAMDRHFKQWPLDPAAVPLVAACKQHGYKLCLITGSVDRYAEAVAHRLGI